MIKDLFEAHLLEEGVLKPEAVLVAASIYYKNGIDYIRVHLLPNEPWKEPQMVDLGLSVTEFERRFPATRVLVTKMGTGELERAISTLR